MDTLLAGLSLEHSEALSWFAQHYGQIFSTRPSDVGLPLKLTDSYRGIWKPAALNYPLSVSVTHKGPYRDSIQYLPDGSWEMQYAMQGTEEADYANPRRRATNRAMFRAMDEKVPVGVVVPSKGSSYQVLGLGMIINFNPEYGLFTLTGPVVPGSERTPTVTPPSVHVELIPFDVDAPAQPKERVLAEVHRRQGQQYFRRQLVVAYEGRCAFSNFDSEPALEAAHIIPYKGIQTNHPANGLLLRADLHTLFDVGLVSVETHTMSVVLSHVLESSMYEPMHGARLHLPRDPQLRPSTDALDRHKEHTFVG